MFDYQAWSGKIAGIVALAAFVPYLLATLKRKNRPNRATWLIWFIVGIILLTSFNAAGAADAIWVSVANVITIGLIVLLSIKYGEGGFSFFDGTCLLAAGLAVFLWWYFASPFTALYLCIVIDLIGALPTIKKSYLDPKSENHLTWVLFFVANTLNLFAVPNWGWAMGAYPLYLFLISAIIMGILSLRHEKCKLV